MGIRELPYFACDDYHSDLVVHSWAPSRGDHLFTCGAIFWPPHRGNCLTARPQTNSSIEECEKQAFEISKN